MSTTESSPPADAPDVEVYIEAAKQHGLYSEPDHEVGDLQSYLRAAWRLMAPEQHKAFAAAPSSATPSARTTSTYRSTVRPARQAASPTHADPNHPRRR